MLPLSLARRITLSPPPRPWQLPITALPRQPAALIYFPMGDSPEPEFMLYFRWNVPRVFIRFLPLRRVAKGETYSTTGWRLNIKLGSIGGEKVAVFFTITFICARDKCGKYRWSVVWGRSIIGLAVFEELAAACNLALLLSTFTLSSGIRCCFP